MRLDAWVLALVALAWLPANHYFPWGSAWQEGLALAAVAVAALLHTGPARLPRPWLALLLVAAGSVLVQQLTGLILFAGDAWMVGLYLLALVLALAAGAGLVSTTGTRADTGRLELLCLALLAAALASAGIGFAQWAGVQNLGIFGADLPPGRRPFANFGQPNHWCTASLLGIASAWTLYEARRLGTPVFALATVVLLMAMVVSGSRTGWLQLGALAALWLLLRGRVGLRLGAPHLLVGLVVYAVAWLVWPLLQPDGEGGAAVRTLAEQARPGVRLPLWQAMLDAIAQRPWLGYGWQQMVLAQQAVALDGEPLQRHFEHAHNLVLDLLLWCGVPVGLLLIAWAGATLWRTLAGTRDARAAGLMLGVGGVLAHGMVEFAVEYAYFLLPLGLMLGAAQALAQAPMRDVPAWTWRAVAGFFAAALALTAWDYLKAEQGYRIWRLESAKIGVAGPASPVPDLVVLNQLHAFLVFSTTEPRAGASAADLDRAQRVARRFAQSSAQLRLAHWQALNGDADGAQRTLRLLCAMHPASQCESAGVAWERWQAREPRLRAVAPPAVPR